MNGAWLLQRRGRLLALAIGVLVVLGVATGLTRLKLDNSFEIWFPEDDPGLVTYQRFLDDYGNDEAIVVGIELPDQSALTQPRLERLWVLTRELEAMGGVAHVQTLSEGIVDALADPFVDADLAAPFVDAEERAYRLFVWLERDDQLDARRRALLAAVHAAAAAAFEDHRGIRLAGTGVILNALNEATLSESAVLLPLSYLVILTVVWLVTRKAAWVGVTICAVAAANVVTFGVMGLAGRPITTISMAIAPLILVIAACNTLHLARSGTSRRAVLVPILFSGLTSAAGFASLAAAEMAITRDYGMFAALGIVAATLFSLLGAAFVSTGNRREAGSRFTWRLVSVATGRWPMVLLLGVAVALGAGWYARNLTVDTDPLGFLGPTHPVQQDHTALEARFGPYLPMEFVLTREGGWDASDHESLAAVIGLQRAVERMPEVASSYSYADQVLAAAYLPEYALASPSELRWLDDSGRHLRITFLVEVGSARTARDLGAAIVALAPVPEMTELAPTGYLPMYGRPVDRLMQDQARSLGLAVLVIFTLIAVLFRDARLMTAAALANLPIILVLAALMTGFGISLDVATITVAPALLGLIVDDTIHFLYAYQSRCKAGAQAWEAAAKSGAAVGSTLALTTLTLALGFAVLGFADVATVGSTGVLMAVGVVVALVADLVLLPAMLVALHRRKGFARSRHHASGGTAPERSLA